jgi:hypothetical protein
MGVVSVDGVPGRSGVRISVGEQFFFFSKNKVVTDSGAHSASCSANTVFGGRSVGVRVLKLTTHLHLVPRLRMSGVLPPVCPYGMGRGSFIFFNFIFLLLLP